MLITKSDDTVNPATGGIALIGGTGDVAVRMLGGKTVTFKAVPSGRSCRFRLTGSEYEHHSDPDCGLRY
jgi:hypothetical protein